MTPGCFMLRFRPGAGWPWVHSLAYLSAFEAGRDGAVLAARLHPHDEYGGEVHVRVLGVDPSGDWCAVSRHDLKAFDAGWNHAVSAVIDQDNRNSTDEE